MSQAENRLRERTVRSEQVYAGRVVGLRVDEVALPDGGRSRREIVVHPGAVAGVAIAEDRVLLVRQWRHAAGRVLLEIPAGTLEPGEAPERTMQRELIEEIGYQAGSLRPLADLYTAPGYSSELIRIYLAEDLRAARAQADADERIEVVPLPLAEALRRCRAGELQDAKTAAGLLLAAARLSV
ncbi:MAG: NUDIX domain-containing protein [Armatimonadota bacterium]